LIPLDLEKALAGNELTVSGTVGYEGEESFNAAGLEKETKFCGPKGLGEDFVLTYHFKTPILVKGYSIMSANDWPERDPANFSIFADENQEKLIHSVEGNGHFEDRHTSIKRAFEAPVTTSIVQLRVHQIDGEDGSCQFTQFRLYH